MSDETQKSPAVFEAGQIILMTGGEELQVGGLIRAKTTLNLLDLSAEYLVEMGFDGEQFIGQHCEEFADWLIANGFAEGVEHRIFWQPCGVYHNV